MNGWDEELEVGLQVRVLFHERADAVDQLVDVDIPALVVLEVVDERSVDLGCLRLPVRTRVP